MQTDDYDVAVVGAGFGGLAAALSLADRGAKVALFERLTYPGGCASTFSRRGWSFESGATLFSGFGAGHLFDRWIERFDLDVNFQSLDPVVEMRTGEFELGIPNSRRGIIDAFSQLDDVPAHKIQEFFKFQGKVADVLWSLFREPELLPPFSAGTLLRHLRRTPDYAPLAGLLGRPLSEVLSARGWDGIPQLETYLDAVCQITVQAPHDRAEATFALAATDYFFRGTGHIKGGIGRLAWALVDAIRRCGGDVHMADEVTGLSRWRGRWTVESRRRTIRADTVVANALPRTVATLTDTPLAANEALSSMSGRVEDGWGAAMLYLGLEESDALPEGAHHFELIGDSGEPLTEGNHVFCSMSGADEAADRTPSGEGRTVTCSTHVPMKKLLGANDAEQASYIEEIQARMRRTIQKRAPELRDATEMEMTASPRTFERFTNRPSGFVGGVPRTAGLHNYTGLFPSPHTPVMPDLYMVGDSVFPGQSTLACALGGVSTARAIERATQGSSRRSRTSPACSTAHWS